MLSKTDVFPLLKITFKALKLPFAFFMGVGGGERVVDAAVAILVNL